jgi:hypothetical protein
VELCSVCGLERAGDDGRCRGCAVLARLLEDVERFVRRYVVFASDAQPVALAVWIAHAHTIKAADCTAYLAITSPAKRSGKARLLELLELLVPSPLRTSNISDAALFRIIDEARPVILLDEADAIFGPKSDREDLRALLNAGYRRGAEVVRCEANGKAQVVRRFDAFSAKALAAIGDLPDTVSDRCIPIRLQRRAPSEPIERFRYREAALVAAPIREALAAWAEKAVADLRDARPELPDALNDRAQDGWEPLLAIADLAGGWWPEFARSAAIALHEAVSDYVEEDLELLALRHVREAFAYHEDPEAMWTVDLLRALTARDDGPWAEWWGESLEHDRTQGPAQRLRRLLMRFGVTPRTVRIGDATRKGYRLTDLSDTAIRHLGIADTSSQAVTPLARAVTAVSAVTASGDEVEPGYMQIQRDAGEAPETDELRARRRAEEVLGAS